MGKTDVWYSKNGISIIQISTCNTMHKVHANGQKGEPAWGDFFDAHASSQHSKGELTVMLN